MNNKIIISIMLVFLLVLPLVASADWDNVKDYDAESNTITITNALGLGERLVRMQLMSEQDQEVIDQGEGVYQQVALIKFHKYKSDLDGALEGIDIYNLATGGLQEGREYKLKYRITTEEREENMTQTTCDKLGKNCVTELLGTRTIEEYDWIEFTELSELPKQNIFIGVYVDVLPGEHGEWIPNKWFGEEIPEWASWIEGINTNLLIYNTYNETSGNDASDSLGFNNLSMGGDSWGTGVIGNGFNASALGAGTPCGKTDIQLTGQRELTINYWIRRRTIIGSPTEMLFYGPITAGGQFAMERSSNTAINALYYDSAQRVGGDIELAEGTYTMITYRINSSTATLFKNGAREYDISNTTVPFASGKNLTFWATDSCTNQLDGYSVDESSAWNRSLSDAEVTSLYNGGSGITYVPNAAFVPTVTLNSPSNGASQTSPITFNCSAEDNEGVINLSLYVDGDIKASIVNSSANENLSLESMISVLRGTHNWTCVGFDSGQTLSWATSNFTIEIVDFSENAQDFNATSVETAKESFTINITYNTSNFFSAGANLIYGGISQTASPRSDGSNTLFTTNLDIPLITSGEQENKTFLWQISLANGTGVFYSNTSLKYQNNTRMHLEFCNATYTDKTINFTTRDEQNLTRIPFTFDATFDFWAGDGSVKRTHSYLNLSSTELDLCITPGDKDLRIGGTLEYNAVNTSSYTQRTYDFDNVVINSTIQHIQLLLLETTSSTSFIQHVLDGTENVVGAIIRTYRFYPGTNEWLITQIGTTDNDGKTIGFYKTETVDYRHEILLNNVLRLNETSGRKIFGETAPFTLTFQIGVVNDSLPILVVVEGGQTVNLSFNPTTQIVTYAYTDTNSSFLQGRLLLVEERYNIDDIIICNTTSSLTSAQITCDLSNLTGEFIGEGYITRSGESEQLKVSDRFNINDAISSLGIFGIIGGIFIIITAGLLFLANEIAGIVAIDVAVLLVKLTGIINFGTKTLFAIFAMSIIVIVVLSKK